MKALPDFTFSVAGEGVAIDPATGLLTIATEALLSGVGVVLTARDATGTPVSAFKITVTLADDGTGGGTEPVAAPEVVGALADLALTQGEGTVRVETAGVFSGTGLVFSVAGGEGVIDAATGALDLPLGTLRAAETVVVTATNAGGVAQARFALTIAAPLPAVAAPEVSGALADQFYALAEGTASISTQAYFSGEDLVYALEAAPGDVTLQPGSGLVTVPTGAALEGRVTVSATNAGGTARLSFGVAVRATATAFSEAAALSDVAFLTTEGAAAPAFTFDSRGFARLVPATAGRTHGLWSKAGGDGLYRALARWSSLKPKLVDNMPFVFGLRLARSGENLSGAYLAVHRPADVAQRGFRLFEYTGVGDAAVELGAVVSPWSWDTLTWIEAEVSGRRIRARAYAEGEAVPGWMIEAETSAPQGGGFGPGSFPNSGVSPTILLKSLEFTPFGAEAPVAAAEADWTLSQITE